MATRTPRTKAAARTSRRAPRTTAKAPAMTEELIATDTRGALADVQIVAPEPLPVVERNGLRLQTQPDGSITCLDLAEVEGRFNAEHAEDAELRTLIEQRIAAVRSGFEIEYPSREARDAVPEQERRRLGGELFDTLIAPVREEASRLGSFRELLFWASPNWWYDNPVLRASLVTPDIHVMHNGANELVQQFLLPALPAPVRRELSQLEDHFTAVEHGHFALMAVGEDIRRVVTDTQLFELHGVYGYAYLDVLPDGRPVTRSRTDEGGGRAFFDGKRLMAHRRFQTCAPKVVPIDGGYKVNSTGCTIVEGQLFDLIDAEDRVAHTNGAFMGMVDFSKKDQIEAMRISQASATRMQVANGKVTLDGKALRPIGTFLPSTTDIHANGFTHVHPAEFVENASPRVERALVIDDRADWIERVTGSFEPEEIDLPAVQTTSRTAALAAILETNPPAVLLDIHLTPDEQFDGIWIANQLAGKGFAGEILLTSSMGQESLTAVAALIRRPVHIPGKDPARVRQCLSKTCRCPGTRG